MEVAQERDEKMQLISKNQELRNQVSFLQKEMNIMEEKLKLFSSENESLKLNLKSKEKRSITLSTDLEEATNQKKEIEKKYKEIDNDRKECYVDLKLKESRLNEIEDFINRSSTPLNDMGIQTKDCSSLNIVQNIIEMFKIYHFKHKELDQSKRMIRKEDSLFNEDNDTQIVSDDNLNKDLSPATALDDLMKSKATLQDAVTPSTLVSTDNVDNTYSNTLK